MVNRSFEDLRGQRFSRLLVVDLNINEKAVMRYRREWICLCDCGNFKTVRRPDGLKSGDIKSCGCYSKETILRAVKAITLPKGEAAFNVLYGDYKKTARNKKVGFTLTKKQFRFLTKSNCVYCDSEPSRLYGPSDVNGKYRYNGVDRQDNDKGYIIENCVPCCRSCNFMKGTLSVSKFLTHVNKINSYRLTGEYKEQKPIIDKPDIIAVRPILWEYKKNARVKGLKFELSEEVFIKLTSGDCIYCGQVPGNKRHTQNKKRSYIYNGIDRVDSSKGYEKGNCVSCCSTCNYMKRRKTVSEFYGAVDLINKEAKRHHSFLVLE